MKHPIRIWLKEKFGKKPTPPFFRGQEKFQNRYPRFEIGVGTYGLPEIHDWNQGTTCRIGAYTSIADEVQILLGGMHRTDWVSTYPFPSFFDEVKHIHDSGWTRGDVNIGNDVWLAFGCTILSGVTIGNGAVVAARSVVARDVPPYAVVAGSPAKIIRYRFDKKTREALLESAWWTWPIAEVRKIAHLLCATDMNRFLAYATNRKDQRTQTASRTLNRPGFSRHSPAG